MRVDFGILDTQTEIWAAAEKQAQKLGQEAQWGDREALKKAVVYRCAERPQNFGWCCRQLGLTAWLGEVASKATGCGGQEELRQEDVISCQHLDKGRIAIKLSIPKSSVSRVMRYIVLASCGTRPECECLESTLGMQRSTPAAANECVRPSVRACYCPCSPNSVCPRAYDHKILQRITVVNHYPSIQLSKNLSI